MQFKINGEPQKSFEQFQETFRQQVGSDLTPEIFDSFNCSALTAHRRVNCCFAFRRVGIFRSPRDGQRARCDRTASPCARRYSPTSP